ncbi:MAG: DUF4838 domain-containing protein [Bacteroidales bacterium]|jgi:hypothetical protein|nr:DUF4838 domain-containing protein [Bacteroidales bacterium]
MKRDTLLCSLSLSLKWAMILLLILTSCSRDRYFEIRPSGRYAIVTGDDADSLTLLAAAELEKYIKMITSLDLNTTGSRGTGIKTIIIGRKGITDTALLEETGRLSRDGFIISATGTSLLLAGNNGAADLNAVYTLLEEHAGCIWFTGTEELVPRAKKISIPYGKKSYEPAFSFRVAHFPDRDNSFFVNHNKMSTFNEWGLFVHTFQTLMPPSEYFGKHPEYFSLVNGRRIQDGQLCLSNPEVIRILTENLAGRMKEAPYKIYWSVSQNDCINYCECDGCRKMYEKYGNISGAYIEMANKLASHFPDKQISTLAYQFTRQAPVNIVPAPNVNVMFCSIECNRSMPLADDPRSAAFVKDLSDWSLLTKNIFMWDYVVQFRTYLCPFPNFHTIQPNIQLFHSHGIPMMFQQGSGRSWSDLAELKQYYISKLLWDPDLNGDSLINRFITAYYGGAAPYIREYYDLSHSSLKEVAVNNNLDIYGLPSYYFGSFLSRDLVTRYHDLMNKAEYAAAGDSVILSRVLRARMSVDFAWLDHALNAGDMALSFIKRTPAGKSISEEMMAALDRVLENSEKTGVWAVSEHQYSLEEYREHVQRLVSMGVKENKVKPEEFSSLTEMHQRYSVPGAASLADGIFGGRGFTQGWLGYEGEDMVIEVTPQSPVTTSRISMNFLCDHVSWIFLPTEVIIETSADGVMYNRVAGGKYVTTSFDQDITPVHMEYEFPEAEVLKIRITAKSMKKCPEWHRGAGMPSWIFVDEIVVE